MASITVGTDNENTRLDVFLASALTDVSRSSIRKMIDDGLVLLNGKTAKPSSKVKANDVLEYTMPEVTITDIAPEDIPIDVVFEDNYLIVINKPKGMASHPAPGTSSGTVVNAMLAHTNRLSSVGGNERQGIVHRLDKDTSGLMIIARSNTIHWKLQKQMQNHAIKRKYLALVWGNPKFDNAEVDAAIGRHPGNRKKMAVITSTEYPSRNALTYFSIIERLGTFTLVEAQLHTGRTHQIRVHAAYAGHPVVGDSLYSGDRRLHEGTPQYVLKVNNLIDDMKGQALHAYHLSFTHPVTKELMEFNAEMPSKMKALYEYLKEECGK